MYGIELAYLTGKKYAKARSDLLKRVGGIASMAKIPEIQAKSDFISQILRRTQKFNEVYSAYHGEM